MNANESFIVHEKKGSEVAGNLLETILSKAFQRCLLRLGSSVPKSLRSFVWQLRHFGKLAAECFKA